MMEAYEEQSYKKVGWDSCGKEKWISAIVLNSKAIQKIPTSGLHFTVWIWGSTSKL